MCLKTLLSYPDAPRGIEKSDRFSAIDARWKYSYETLGNLSEALAAEFQDSRLSLAVAGSLGRLDASEHSDFDYLVLTDEGLTDEAYKACVERVRRVVEPFALRLPNANGVFTMPISVAHIVTKVGSQEDNLCELAHRMLLLMEARPLINEELFRKAQDDLLDAYFAYQERSPEKEAVFLLNDVIRYFRSICVNYQFNFWNEERLWPLRNVKLRHSRLVMYAGLLFLILNASTRDHRDKKYDYVRSNLELSPIERIVHVYADNADSNIDRVLGYWNFFLEKLSDDNVRMSLRDTPYEDRYSNTHYADLKVNSDGLQSELTRFIWARREQSSSRVYEYLFF